MPDNLMPGEQGGIPDGLLDKFKNQAKPAPINVNDMNSYNFGLSPEEEQAYNASQEKFKPVSQPLSVHDYYPNQGDPIAVGQSSGRIIGTQTQYVPNGALVPIGMWDARDAAIQKAAVAKARDVEEWKSKNMTKPPTSDLTSINDALRTNFFKHQNESWEKAKRQAGGDQNKAKFILENDQDYQEKNKAFYDQAKLGTTVFKHIEDANNDKAKGMIITPEYQDYITKMNAIQDPSTDEFKQSAQHIQNMGVVKDMNDVFNLGIKDMEMDQSSNSWIGDEGDYITENERGEKYYSPQAIDRQKKMMYSHYGLGDNGEARPGSESSYINKSRIDSMVDGAMSARIKTSKKNASFKPSDKGDIEDLDVNNISNEKGSLLGNVVTETKEDGTNKKIGSGKREGTFSQHDGITLQKPVSVVLPASADVTDMTTGKKRTDKSVRNAVIGGIFNGYIANGQIVDDEVVADKKLSKALKVEPLVTVIFKEKDRNGKEHETTGIMPLKQVQNALLGKNNKNKPVIDHYFSKAEERTKELHSSKAPETTASQSKIFLHHKGKNYTEEEVSKTASEYGYTAQEYVDWLKSQK